MKRKELKNLAEKIAKCEYIVDNSNDSKAVSAAQQEIMRLTSKVHDFQDLDQLDELVQDYLQKLS